VAYVVSSACVGVKDASCVSVCPVDCIHPTPDEDAFHSVQQLYVDPDECIDCDACVAVCPADAIGPEEELAEDERGAIAANAAYYA
jgi:NAD-dependent dihydropyrimidine dehydrogenase PreA subunit